MLRALGVLTVLGPLAILPPYLGPEIGLKLQGIADKVEIVDHVVPGVVIFLAAGASFLLVRAGRLAQDSLVLATAVAICMLAGVWQTSSHIPLVLDGGRPESPWDAVVFHSTLGPIITGLSLWLVLRVLAVDAGQERRATS